VSNPYPKSNVYYSVMMNLFSILMMRYLSTISNGIITSPKAITPSQSQAIHLEFFSSAFFLIDYQT